FKPNSPHRQPLTGSSLACVALTVIGLRIVLVDSPFAEGECDPPAYTPRRRRQPVCQKAAFHPARNLCPSINVALCGALVYASVACESLDRNFEEIKNSLEIIGIECARLRANPTIQSHFALLVANIGHRMPDAQPARRWQHE